MTLARTRFDVRRVGAGATGVDRAAHYTPQAA